MVVVEEEVVVVVVVVLVVFAATYEIDGHFSDPDVLVNPLAALTPGFLRNLFNVFGIGSLPK